MSKQDEWKTRMENASKQFEAGVTSKWEPDISQETIGKRVDVLQSWLAARVMREVSGRED